MPLLSLVNFAKIYSIDFDVPVINFGEVDNINTLLNNWDSWRLTVNTMLTDEERRGHQVEDRKRHEQNQDKFGDD